jgi:hypothetical protein
MLLLAVLLVANTAESTQVENARQTVVLECAVVMPDDPGGDPGPMPPPDPAMQQLEPTTLLPRVIAVSGTPDAPAISIGDPCGIAIGELINNRFRLLSATPTAPMLSPGTALPPEPVSSVQYLFVSKPEPQWSYR